MKGLGGGRGRGSGFVGTFLTNEGEVLYAGVQRCRQYSKQAFKGVFKVYLRRCKGNRRLFLPQGPVSAQDELWFKLPI